MSLKTSAKYEFMPVFARLILNNPNASIMTPIKILSGVGPFDFSSVESDGSIPVSVKVDTAAAIDTTVDLSAASDISAVTVAELVTAWTGAVATATGMTASVDSDTGRLKLAKTSPGSTKYVQVSGEFARLAGFGYGFGAIIVNLNTQQSVAFEGVQKDSERLEILDTQAEGAAIVTDPKRTGNTVTLTDTATDQLMKAILTGGTYDFETGQVSSALPGAIRPTFTLESYSGMYATGDNFETDANGYLRRRLQSCKGTGEAAVAGDRNGQAKGYTISATAYRDPVTLVKSSDTTELELTVEEYEALDLANY